MTMKYHRLFVYSSIAFCCSFFVSPCIYAASPTDAPERKTVATPTPPVSHTPSITIQQLWTINTDVDQETASTNLQPVITADEIIMLTPKGQLNAYKKTSGQALWKHSIGKSIKTGPVVHDESIIVVTARSQLRAYNRHSFKLRWSADIPGDVLATPRIDHDLLIVKTLNGKVIAFNLETGEQRWFYQHNTSPSLTLHKDSMPVVAQDKVLVGFSDGRMIALNRDTGAVLWQKVVARPSGLNPVARLMDMSAELIATDDTVYVLAEEQLVALSIDDGHALWNYPVPSHNTIAINNNTLYIIDSSGVLRALNLQQGGTLLWQQQIPSKRKVQAPVLLDGYILAADNAGDLYLADSNNGAMITRQNVTKNRLNRLPIVDNNAVYYLTDKGNLIALKLRSAQNIHE